MSERPRLDIRGLGLIGLLGGLGGAINAWLCYARFPVPVGTGGGGAGGDPPTLFSWHIIPSGAAHGVLLSIICVGLTAWLLERNPRTQWIGLPAVGWLSGWVSGIPIRLYMDYASTGSEWGFGHGSGLSGKNVLLALFWPFESLGLSTLYVPYLWFGLVGFMYCAALIIANHRPLLPRGLVGKLLIGVVSGIGGSLYFWISWKPWYFSLIHGTIWGSLVGFGVWRVQREARVD